MADQLIRTYNILDIKSIKPHLMIYGDLSAACGNCSEMDIKLDNDKCPKCDTEFKYISFRNMKSHIPNIHKLFKERPRLKIVDFDDYKRNEGAVRAEEFLK